MSASSLYLLHGTEGVLITEQLHQLRRQAQIDDLNLETVDFSDKSGSLSEKISALTELLQASPLALFAGRRMVVVRDLPLLGAGKKTKDEDASSSAGILPVHTSESTGKMPVLLGKKEESRDRDIEGLIEALGQVGDDTLLVFTFQENSDWQSSRKVDKRKKLYKFLQKTGTVLEFNSFSEWDTEKLFRWIADRVKLQGKTMDSSAIHCLAEVVGSQLGVLASEIDKMVTYVGTAPAISKEDVLLLASEGQSAGFALVNALRDRDTVRALKALKNALFHGESEVALMAGIVSQFRLLAQVKYLLDEKTPPGEIGKHTGGHPYVIKLLIGAARKYTFAELNQIIHLLAEADVRLKTGRMAKEVLLEMVVVDIGKGMKGSLLFENMVD